MPAHGSPGRLPWLSLYMGRNGAAVAQVLTRSLPALPCARQCATAQTGRPCRTLCQLTHRPNIRHVPVDACP